MTLKVSFYSCAAQAYVVSPANCVLRSKLGDRAVAILEAQGTFAGGRVALSGTMADSAIYSSEWEASLAYCRRSLVHATTLGDPRL